MQLLLVISTPYSSCNWPASSGVDFTGIVHDGVSICVIV